MQIGCRIRLRINIKIMWRLERNLYELNMELVRLNCNGKDELLKVYQWQFSLNLNVVFFSFFEAP